MGVKYIFSVEQQHKNGHDQFSTLSQVLIVLYLLRQYLIFMFRHINKDCKILEL